MSGSQSFSNRGGSSSFPAIIKSFTGGVVSSSLGGGFISVSGTLSGVGVFSLTLSVSLEAGLLLKMSTSSSLSSSPKDMSSSLSNINGATAFFGVELLLTDFRGEDHDVPDESRGFDKLLLLSDVALVLDVLDVALVLDVLDVVLALDLILLLDTTLLLDLTLLLDTTLLLDFTLPVDFTLPPDLKFRLNLLILTSGFGVRERLGVFTSDADVNDFWRENNDFLDSRPEDLEVDFRRVLDSLELDSLILCAVAGRAV